MSTAKGFVAEFREFAVKGNMMDLAIGVIIGAAFGKIINSLVNDIVMPVVNFIVGGKVDFVNQFFVLAAPANYSGPHTYDAMTKAGAVLLGWGSFLTVFVNFVLLALVVFCMVKAVNNARQRMAKEQEEAPAAPAPTPDDVVLLREIRDLLRK
jgi:large conductance mechanosensitive channel